MTVADDLLNSVGARKFSTILADPPWRFHNRTGKMAPEHRRLARYPTMSFQEIGDLPIESIATETAHLYLWVPNALLPYGLEVMDSWGFSYKTNIVWYKVRKDGGPDRRGVGFYFRNVTEVILFGVRGKNARTLKPGRSQENILVSRKREHSRKPDEQYDLIEACSPGPFIELFARGEAGSGGGIKPTRTPRSGTRTRITRRPMQYPLASFPRFDSTALLKVLHAHGAHLSARSCTTGC